MKLTMYTVKFIILIKKGLATFFLIPKIDAAVLCIIIPPLFLTAGLIPVHRQSQLQYIFRLSFLQNQLCRNYCLGDTALCYLIHLLVHHPLYYRKDLVFMTLFLQKKKGNEPFKLSCLANEDLICIQYIFCSLPEPHLFQVPLNICIGNKSNLYM